MSVIACMSAGILYGCGRHAHKNWEVVLQLQGQVVSRVGDQTYTLSPGDIQIIPPGTYHDGRSEEGYADLYFLCEYLDFYGYRILHDYDGAVLSLMQLLHKASTEEDPRSGPVRDGLLEAICAYLHKYDETAARYPFVHALKETIYQNFSNAEFDLADAVRKTGYHADYVRRCFREETGRSALEYLTDLRLQYARKLLQQEIRYSVAEISERCGYRDTFYFSRLFKQHFGVPPLQYRKQNDRPDPSQPAAP